MSTFRKSRPKVAIKKKGLILCEGQTEVMYFKGLTSQEKYRRDFAAVDVEIFKPKDHSPRGLVTEAKKMMKAAKKDDPYDFVWIVFDLDGHGNIADTFEQALQSKPPIQIGFTAKCFEYYVLLHFARTAKAHNRCDDIIAEVKKYLPGYQKATNDVFSTLAEFQATALSNSEWLMAQNQADLENGARPYNLSSYSNIHELVGFLMSLVQAPKTAEVVEV